MCVFASRLADNIYAWRNIKASKVVQEWITEGVRLPFHQDYIPGKFELPNHKLSQKERAFLVTEIQSLELRGCIERVQQRPHCVSPIKCIPKK